MTATIRREAQRYSTWMKIFATDTIRIIEPPKPGQGGFLRMLVDVAALTDEQRARLARHISSVRLVPCDQAMNDMMEAGSVLISAQYVDVRTEEARLF